jgi:maleate isomerase
MEDNATPKLLRTGASSFTVSHVKNSESDAKIRPQLAYEDARRELRRVTEVLLEETNAGRTTLRLDWPTWDLHVDDVSAEARQVGVASLEGATSIDQRQAETVRWLERERRLLVQRNCEEAEERPPSELLQLYGVQAQMLGPVIRGDRLIGWLSVHELDGPRDWTSDDRNAVEEAIVRVNEILDISAKSRD